MRVVILEPDASGGMAHFAFMLARGLSAQAARVTLITPEDYELSSLPHDFELRKEFRLWPRVEPGRGEPEIGAAPWLTRIYRRVIRRSWRALRLTQEMGRVTGLVAKERPALVLLRPFPLPGRRLMLARLKRSGATIVEVSHEFEARDTTRPLAAALERALAGNADTSIDLRLFLGESVRDRYAVLHPQIPRSRMQVIPHGDGEMFELLARDDVDMASRLGLEESEEAVLFFGNLRPSKGVEDLVEAFGRASRPPQARLLIVGYPSPEIDVGALRERARGLGIDDLVRFDIGYLPNELVAPLFRLARFVALPYRSATQSGPLHIAFTFAKPVLATRTGGIIDVIDDGVTGLLVEPGNVSELAAGLEQLMWDDLLVERMGQSVEVKREDFRWSVVAAQVLDATGKIRSGDR